VRAIPFFPETSWVYAYSFLEKAAGAKAALAAADRVWTSNVHYRGEGEDPYYRLCFGKGHPLDGEFEELAVAVFEPLLRHRRVIGPDKGERG